MPLWLILGIEALVILAILVQMLRKRASAPAAEEGEEAGGAAGARAPQLNLDLPPEEKWE
jgi:hypothetical protein